MMVYTVIIKLSDIGDDIIITLAMPGGLCLLVWIIAVSDTNVQDRFPKK